MWRVQEEVGETEVSEQAPRTDQPLQVRELRTVEVGVLPRELGEGGHRRSLRTGPRRTEVTDDQGAAVSSDSAVSHFVLHAGQCWNITLRLMSMPSR